MTTYQTRFVAFAADMGRTPEEQAAVQRDNVDFFLWVRCRRAEWRDLTGKTAASPISDADHKAFDEWLAARQVTS